MKKIEWLNIVKVVAIVLVVMIHCIELIYIQGQGAEFWLSVPSKERVLMTILFTIGRCAVPLFLLVSGYLLLSRDYDTTEKCLNFYKNKIIPLLKETWIWIILYILFDIFVMKKQLSWSTILQQLFLLEYPNVVSFWYIPMLIGLYFLYPLIAIILNKIDFSVIKYVFFLGVFNYLLFPSIQRFLQVKYGIVLPSFKVQPALLNGLYGLYAVTGFYLKKNEKFSLSRIASVILFGVPLLLAAAFQFLSWRTQNHYWIWYDSIFIFLASLGLFYFFKSLTISKKWTHQLISKISNYTLTIYFCHLPIQMTLNKFVEINNRIAKVSILFLVSLVLSVIIAFILGEVKNRRQLKGEV